MKAFVIALCILLAITILIVTHSIIMIDFADEISKNCQWVSEMAQAEDWEQALKGIDKIKTIWDKKRIWVALTISTEEIEQIEISLNQSRIFAELNEKSDFFGEFTMFTMLVGHIPHQEGFHIAEIL